MEARARRNLDAELVISSAGLTLEVLLTVAALACAATRSTGALSENDSRLRASACRP
jgi:hypothetical protein